MDLTTEEMFKEEIFKTTNEEELFERMRKAISKHSYGLEEKPVAIYLSGNCTYLWKKSLKDEEKFQNIETFQGIPVYCDEMQGSPRILLVVGIPTQRGVG